MIHRLARIAAELRTRLRAHFARSFRSRRALIFVPSIIAALVVGTFLVGLNRERADWGKTSTVFVAKLSINPDTPLDDTVLERMEVPLRMVPQNALRTMPRGNTMRAVGEGEILVTADIAPASSLPADWVVIGVGAIDESLQLGSGDRVIALADGVIVCGDGRVSAATHSSRTGETRVSVGVPESCAPELARAVTDSQVVLALVPSR